MKNKIKLPISLIIPCYNRLAQTAALLDSISKSDFECEVIIVDDCSTTDYMTTINGYPDLNIKYYRNKSNRGPAYCRNKGIELASHEYIAFTDNDCIVTNDWLIRLYEYITNSKNKVAAVGGKVIAKNNDLISLYFTYHKILDPWYHRGQYYYVTTANSIFKKLSLLEVGGFDTSLKKAGGEDPGLCFKLAKKGYEFLYNPDAIIIHDYNRSLFKLFKTFYNYGFGCSIQTRKHYKTPQDKNNNYFAGIEGDIHECVLNREIPPIKTHTYLAAKPTKDNDRDYTNR